MTPAAATERTTSHAQNVRDAIDRITDTPFDKLTDLFDRIAKEADKAVRTEAALIEAMEGADNTLCCLGVDKNGLTRKAIAGALALTKAASTRPAAPFYGAQCPSYPNCTGGCGLGCTHEIEGSRASKTRGAA